MMNKCFCGGYMRILQVIPALVLAGAQTMCENLIMELKKDENNKIEVISFFDVHSEITERLEKNNVKIHYLNKKKGLDLSIIFKLRKVIDEFKPDIIHTHIYVLEYVIPCLRICKKKDIKVIHTVHNIADKEVPKRLQRIQRIWFKRGIAKPIAISELIQESISTIYQIEKSDIPIIYNGIDLSKCIIKENYEVGNNILHIGRFSEQKNHRELIEIFSECLKENKILKLYLVGEGELKSQIEKIVKKLKIEKNIEFLGSLPECYEIMNKADIFVLPSKWEGVPMTIIEAMGTGLPVIASNVGGVSNMINHEKDGFIANNAKDFEKYISTLCKDKVLRERIGKQAIEKSKKFSSKEMAKKYIKIYNE